MQVKLKGKSSYLLKDLTNFNEILIEYVTFHTIKSHNKTGLQPLSPMTFLGLKFMITATSIKTAFTISRKYTAYTLNLNMLFKQG